MRVEIDTTVPTAPVQGGWLRRGARGFWRLIRDLVGHVLVQPYREGRLRSAGWPVGLRSIVLVAVIGYTVAVLGILFSGPLRESLPLTVTTGGLTVSFPRPLLWIVFTLVCIAVALLLTAAIHVRAWLSWLVISLVALVLLFLGGIGGFGEFTLGHGAAFVAIAAIVALRILRSRRAFAWWEFAICFALISFVFISALASAARSAAESGVDFGPLTASLIMSTLGQLAIPSALAAGVAVAEVATTTSLWAVGIVRRRFPLVVLAIGFGLVVLWRCWSSVVPLLHGDELGWRQLLATVALVGAIIVVWILLARARGGRSVASGAVEPFAEEIGGLARTVAAFLSCFLVPAVAILLVSQILLSVGIPITVVGFFQEASELLSHSTMVIVLRIAVGAGLLAFAWWRARQAKRVLPELAAAVGVVLLSVGLGSAFGMIDWWWSSQALALLGTIAALGLAVHYGLRGRLTAERLTALTIALLIAALFQQRDFVSDPLAALLGFTGVAFVLFGFVWSFLTGAGSANKNSAAYPRPARVLFFLANSVFGVTVLAVIALSREPQAAIDLAQFAEFGDQIFGTALLTAVLLALLRGAMRGSAPALDVEGDEPAGPEAATEATTASEGADAEAGLR